MGIEYQNSSRYRPRSNGVAERFNRTILTRARSILIQSKLSLIYWGEAVLHATHLHNVKSSTVLDNCTPFEALFGFKPNISYLRVFGSLAIVQLQNNKFSKSGAKSILLSHTRYVYKIQELSTLNVTLTNQVTFDETVFPSSSEIPNDEYVQLLNRVSINPLDMNEDYNFDSSASNNNEIASDKNSGSVHAIIHANDKFALAVSAPNSWNMPSLQQALKSKESEK